MRKPIRIFAFILSASIGYVLVSSSIYSRGDATTPSTEIEAAKARIAELEQKVTELDSLNRALVKRLADLQENVGHEKLPSSTQQFVATGSVHGSIWVTKGSGDNQFLIGHSVCLLPLKVKAAAFRAHLTYMRTNDIEGIGRLKEEILSDPNIFSNADVEKVQARLQKVELALKAIQTDEIDFLKTYETVRDATIFHRPMLV